MRIKYLILIIVLLISCDTKNNSIKIVREVHIYDWNDYIRKSFYKLYLKEHNKTLSDTSQYTYITYKSSFDNDQFCKILDKKSEKKICILYFNEDSYAVSLDNFSIDVLNNLWFEKEQNDCE